MSINFFANSDLHTRVINQSITTYRYCKSLTCTSYSFCYRQIADFIKGLYVRFKSVQSLQPSDIRHVAFWQIQALLKQETYPALSFEIRNELAKISNKFGIDEWLTLHVENDLRIIYEAKMHLAEIHRAAIATFQQNDISSHYLEYDLFPEYCATSPQPERHFRTWIAGLSYSSLRYMITEYTNSFEHLGWLWEALTPERKAGLVLELSKSTSPKLVQVLNYYLYCHTETFFEACKTSYVLVDESIERIYQYINNREHPLKSRLQYVSMLNSLYSAIVNKQSFYRYNRIDRDLPKDISTDTQLLEGLFKEYDTSLNKLYYIRKILEKCKHDPALQQTLKSICN